MYSRITSTLVVSVLLVFVSQAWAQWVEDSVSVGGPSVQSLVYNPRSDVVYGTRWSLHDVGLFAVSCDSNRVVAQTQLRYAGFLAYDSTDNKVYCTFAYCESLLVVDGTTHERIRAVPLPGANNIIWDAVADRVYVSCGYESHVAVIDCATDSVIALVPTGEDAHRMDINTAHRKLYVRDWDGEALSIIDLERLELIRTIPLSGVPTAGCYSAAADKYYCTAWGELYVLDGATDSILRREQLSSYVSVLQSVESHALILAASYRAASVETLYVLDAYSGALSNTLLVGGSPYSIAWSPSSDLVYVANGSSDDITVIASDGSAVLRTLAVGDAPYSLALVPPHDRLYVGHLNGPYVYVVKDRAGGVVDRERAWPPCAGILRAQPNPFSHVTRIRDPRGAGLASSLRVYCPLGRQVRRLTPGAAGAPWVDWDGRDDSGRPVPAGVYVVADDEGRCSRTAIVKMD